VDAVVSDLPFAVRVNPGKNRYVERLIPKMMCEVSRILRVGGRAVLLTNHADTIIDGCRSSDASESKRNQRRPPRPRSLMAGVSFSPRDQRWRATAPVATLATVYGTKKVEVVFLGCFDLEKEAIQAVTDYRLNNTPVGDTDSEKQIDSKNGFSSFDVGDPDSNVSAGSVTSSNSRDMFRLDAQYSSGELIIETAAAAAVALPQFLPVRLVCPVFVDAEDFTVELGSAVDASEEKSLPSQEANRLFRDYFLKRKGGRSSIIDGVPNIDFSSDGSRISSAELLRTVEIEQFERLIAAGHFPGFVWVPASTRDPSILGEFEELKIREQDMGGFVQRAPVSREFPLSEISKKPSRVQIHRRKNHRPEFHHGLVLISKKTANIGGLLCSVLVLGKAP